MHSFTIRSLAIMALALATHFPSTSAFAQTTAITYQGFLTVQGAPANGTNDFEFKLYDAASAGAQQGSTVTLGDIGVTNGLFTVTLDFGATPFDGSARWLDIAVRPGESVGAYTNLLPRQPITVTPYAVRAANFSGAVAAGQITGTISSNNIGAGSITTVMLATGAVGSNQLASGAVTTSALADRAVTALKVAVATDSALSTTFTNPNPENQDFFGNAVAAVGSDRVLIGAYLDDTGAVNAGAAYLFSTTGTLLTTFTNPTPVGEDRFGWSVAAVGSDRVLIGAPVDDTGAFDAGAAYLFSTNGTLLATFTNPTPATFDSFGNSMAAVGSDRVLIGAPADDTGAVNAGAAYLFSTNGTLLTTFTNPTPADFDIFGNSMAAVGSDRVLIGAILDDTGATDAGAAYLFSTNGTLLATFTNPTPAGGDNFGYAVAAVGTDRVLIGAYNDSTGAAGAGAAYLFSTNGTLLTTFTNPTPQIGDQFGVAVAAVVSDRVLIGAYQDDTGADNAGAAYLFSTNGTLLATFTNPTPASSDFFGSAVAAVGSDRVLIGAYQDDTGALNAGAAYLFSAAPYTPGLVAEGVRSGAIVDANISANAEISDTKLATISTVGKVADTALSANVSKLGSSIESGEITDGTIVDADISASANIADAKLATISTAGKVADTALSANVSKLGSSIESSEITDGTIANADIATGAAIADTKLATLSTAGKVADSALSTNVALRAGGNSFSGNQTITNGNLGVGTTSPTAGLHLVNETAFNTARIESAQVFGTWLNLENNAGGRDWGFIATGTNNSEGAGNLLVRDSTAGAVRMMINTNGNVGIGNLSPTNRLMVVNARCDGSSWINASDRDLKEDFEPVNAQEILTKIAALPIQSWSYKAQPGQKHVGPVAQDFRAAFGLGQDDTSIATVDADGVALAAIQGLNQKVEELKKGLMQKDVENAALKQRLDALEKLLNRLSAVKKGGE